MDITVKTKDLTKALTQAQKYCYKSRRRWYEALEGIRLEAIDNKLHLIATNFDIKYLISINCEVKEEGVAVVKDPKTLKSILKITKSLTINIRKEKEEIIINGDEMYQLDTYDIEEYPLTAGDFVQPQETFAIQGRIIKDALEKVLPIIGNAKAIVDNLLGYVWIDNVHDNLFKIIGTDGYKMAVITIDNYNTIKSIAILSRAAKELKAFANTSSYLTVWQDNSYLYVSIDDEILAIKTVEHPFPNYQEIFNKEATTCITLQKSMLMQALNRLLLSADKNHHAIKCDVNNKNLTLHVKNQKTIIEVEKHGKDVNLEFNGQYLLSILNVMESEIVKLEFFYNQQCIITGNADYGFVSTFMLLTL